MNFEDKEFVLSMKEVDSWEREGTQLHSKKSVAEMARCTLLCLLYLGSFSENLEVSIRSDWTTCNWLSLHLFPGHDTKSKFSFKIFSGTVRAVVVNQDGVQFVISGHFWNALPTFLKEVSAYIEWKRKMERAYDGCTGQYCGS